IVHFLGSAVDLPAAEDVERLAIHDENAWRPVGAVLAAAAERADADTFRAAVDSVGARIAGLPEHLVGLDNLVNLCLGGIGLCVNDINARRADPGNDQV